MLLSYQWRLTIKEERVERYCSGCKRKVVFKDSRVKRHNANGKNIFQYAIFKCDCGHSWNKLIRTYSAEDYHKLSEVTSREEFAYNPIKQLECANEKHDFDKGLPCRIEISGGGIERIDKVIFENSANITRKGIQDHLKSGLILLNQKKVKASKRIRSGDIIDLMVP